MLGWLFRRKEDLAEELKDALSEVTMLRLRLRDAEEEIGNLVSRRTKDFLMLKLERDTLRAERDAAEVELRNVREELDKIQRGG